MKILLRNPRRELEIPGPMSVVKLLARLELNPESVLVIQGDTLVTRDARLSRLGRHRDPPGDLGRLRMTRGRGAS